MMKYVTTVEGQEFLIEILDEHHVLLNGSPFAIDFVTVGDQPVFSLLVEGNSYDAHVYQDDDLWKILFQGGVYSALVEDEREKRLRAALSGNISEHLEYHLRAPMPGLVVSVPVREGLPVNKGDVLLVLESMKMQNELRSPRAGLVARLRVKPGDRVEQKETMMSVV
jgi:biotin carboxyl carrier protein